MRAGVIALLTLCLQLSCSASKDNGEQPLHECDSLALLDAYNAAVRDAEEALPEEISRTLPAIVSVDEPDDPRQQWVVTSDGRQLVLVVSMMSAAKTLKYPDGVYFDMDDRMPWVTLPYDLGDHLLRRLPACADSVACRMRMVQLLGLPPSCDYDYLTFFYAEAASIIRPTPDNETTDHEAQLCFPESATPEYRQWFEANAQASYHSDEPYPWTRLGYTYDWNMCTDSHVGPGEFIVMEGALSKVERKVGVWTWYKEIAANDE